MRIIYLFLLAITAFCSCSPKMSTKVSNKLTPLPDTAEVVVLQKTDPFTNDGIEIGTIKSGETGFSANCTYQEIIGQLKQLARAKGANLIKIVKQKDPDNWSTCVRLTGILYNVPNYRVHEKEIEWSSTRRLCWDDFKAVPRYTLNLAAETSAGFGFEIRYLHAFSKPNITVKTVFDCGMSWVKVDQKYRDDLLVHEQTHFDLTELYARKLRKQLSETKFTRSNPSKESFPIFKEMQKQYRDRQDLYERETDFSLNTAKQAEWTARIVAELNELSAYSIN